MIVLLLLAPLTALLMDLASVVNVFATRALPALTVDVQLPTARVKTAAVAMAFVSVTFALVKKALKVTIVLNLLALLPMDLNATTRENVERMALVNVNVAGTVLLVKRNALWTLAECAMVMDLLALAVTEFLIQEAFLMLATFVVVKTRHALVVTEFHTQELFLMSVMCVVEMERLAAKNNFATTAKLAIRATPFLKVSRDVLGAILRNLVIMIVLNCSLYVPVAGLPLVPSITRLLK